MCKGCSDVQSERECTPLALIMPSLVIWYIAAFRVVFAKPILDSSASLPMPPPTGSDTIDQLNLSPTEQYNPLSDGSSTLVANPSLFGTADLTLNSQVKEEVPPQVTASTGLSNPVVQGSGTPEQEVPEQVASVPFPSDSVIQGDGSAEQYLPVQIASISGLSDSVFHDSDLSKQGSSAHSALPGSDVQDSDSDQTPDETTVINNLSFTIARGDHLKVSSCASKSQSQKRHPGGSSQPTKNPAVLRGPKPPKPPSPPPQEEQPNNSPAQVPKVPQSPPGENKHEECFVVPECEDVDGQTMKEYCCPYEQRIGYDDRHVTTRAGCTDCSSQFLLSVCSILPNPPNSFIT